MKSVSIYNLEAEYINLAQQLIENGGETTPELDQALAINKDALEVKAVKYGYVSKDIQNDIAAIDEEIKRLNALKASRVKAVAKIEETVSTAMKLYGIKDIKLQNLKIWFKPSTAVNIEDESLIPNKYKVKKVEVSISKKLIKADLDAGKKVKGASLDKRDNIQFT